MRATTRKITTAAAAGAAYAALTIAIAPIAYGPVQLRLTEALCVLPFYLPVTAWGLFIGCAIANIMSSAGLLDIVFGSLATLLAALLTARIGRPCRENRGEPCSFLRSLAACAMPILTNTPIVGAVLAYTYMPGRFWEGLLLCAGEVALGETAVMFTLGLVLLRAMPRLPILDTLA